MALKIVGSSPIIHPIKEQIPLGICSFLSVIQYQANQRLQIAEIPGYFVRNGILPAFSSEFIDFIALTQKAERDIITANNCGTS